MLLKRCILGRFLETKSFSVSLSKTLLTTHISTSSQMHLIMSFARVTAETEGSTKVTFFILGVFFSRLKKSSKHIVAIP